MDTRIRRYFSTKSGIATSISLVTGLLFGLSAPALAQFPEKPVKILVGFSAGGGTDTTARGFASYMHESDAMNGQPAFIVNLPGASGQKAAKAVLDTNPDGYTLYMINVGTMMAGELAKGDNAPFNTDKDFVNLGCMSQLVTSLQVHISDPANNAVEWLERVKAEGKTVRWGSSGATSMHSLLGHLFMSEVGLKHQSIPFKGGSKARAALVSQSVDAGFNGVHLTAGFENEIKNLGIPAANRDSVNPDVPTFGEQGLPGINITGLMCLFGPSGMPDDAVSALSKAVADVAAIKGFGKFMKKNNLAAFHTDMKVAAEAQVAMREKMAPIVKEVLAGQ